MKYQTMSALSDLFKQYGTELNIEGNNPIQVTDEQYVWYVQSGMVDLFAENRLSGHSSQRRYLFSVSQGNIILGYKPIFDPSPTALLLIGTETKVLRIERSTFIDAIQLDSHIHSETAQQFEHWINEWSNALRTQVPPTDFIHLNQSESVTVTEGSTVRSNRLIWVTANSDAIYWMDEPTHDVVLNQGDPICIPLAASCWLNLQQESELHLSLTEDLLATRQIWDHLSCFHQLVTLRVEGLLLKEEVRDREKLVLRKANDDNLMKTAITRLLEVTTGSRNTLPPLSSSNSLLYSACQIVGDHAGITMKPTVRQVRSARHVNPIRDIAQASGVRTRQVVLRDEWWTEDNGPLVAFIGEAASPVALIPRPGGYQLINPADTSEQAVSAQLAQQLEPMAHMFYRTLPAHPLKLIDIMRFGAVRSIRKDLVIILILGITMGLLGMLMPIANGILFDTIIPESSRSLLLQMLFILGSVTVTTALFQLTRSFAMLRLETRMDSAIQAAVWDRLLNLPVSFFRQFTSGDLAIRANSINSIRQTISGVAMTSLFSGLFSSFNFFLLFYYDVTLALVSAALVFITLSVTIAIGIMQVRYQRELLAVGGKLSGMILQLINGVSKFRMAAAENRAFFLWSKMFARQKEISFKSRMLDNAFSVFMAFFPIVTSIVLFYFAATRSSGMSAGQFIAFFAAFSAFLGAMMGMSSALVSIVNIVPLFERAKPILQAVPEVHEQLEDPGDLNGMIEVKHVSFRYQEDQPLVLRDLSLQINPGQFVAFIGASGCGKSTLMRLLLSFEKPESGSIYFDGQELKTLDVGLLRSQFGVVLQNSKTMSGDLYTNIVGTSNLTIEEAWEAARMAGFDEDIRQMPMGMHTVVSEGGSTLSGGQRQRLMIARAIARKPSILFFDEATSALDNRTQAIVSESLEQLKATRIVIAHRLSTIMNADCIYVLDKGGIVQQGTYGELIAQPGLFAELAKRQLA
ncbi:MAG: NHLP bacteriocin export ABC transporter permease/ATPase subunit [Candidatus Cohnella colombiensis]|uniref:NHLP bacteriocin export ABC transporter permease/ATPase subunit n=1 Tax=Candidatus Cohnella colombiensis TaxID=3121368 RepID=A0AA95JG97_9BACL|nr:MAG: NHLP bacteriocin export ABC transporter permease/ATPase subunit [Cohnella sp.]